MTKVLMICHGNICRSPMAEFVLRYMVNEKGIGSAFEIASCATSREEIGNDIHYGTKAILKEKQIPFHKREARQVTKKDYEYYDYLICMDLNNIRNLKKIVGDDKNKKIHTLLEFAGMDRDIADPWYTGDFNTTYKDVVLGCTEFLKYLGK